MRDQTEVAGLDRRATRAFGWSFLNTVASRLGTLLIGVALARVLGPHEFGVFGIAMVTLLAVLAFNDLGVSLAIVRWPDEPAAIAPTVNTISVSGSALLTALLVVAAPWVSAALGDARATPVVQVLALSVLVNGLVATPAAVLQREFLQRHRAIADQLNAWLGAAVSLALALAGTGAMSLAVGRLVGSLVAGLLLWHWSPLPYRFGWDPSVARALLRFGAPLAVASVVVFASAYADQVIVGALVGAQALGFYVLAFNLASWPVSIFSQPLRAVAPAAFSRLQHDRAAMSHNLTRLLALLSAVALPACLAISGAAAPVIAFVYGSAWAPSADILLWLALLAALRIWFELAYDYLVVLSRSGRVLAIQAGWFIVGVPAMLLGQRLAGAPGVALAQTLVAAVVVAPAYAVALAAVGVRPVRAAAAVAAPVVAGAATWAVCWWLAGTIGSALVASVSSAAVSLAVMAALVAWHRDAVRGLRGAPA